MDDLFLKIIAGEIPSAKVYEDEYTFAFLDIHPNNKGHVLVVPKIKSRNIFDIDSESLNRMIHTAQKIARAQKNALEADGVNIVMNNELAASQEIFHAHIHVIPRFHGDNVFTRPTHTTYAEGEKEALAEKIKNSIH